MRQKTLVIILVFGLWLCALSAAPPVRATQAVQTMEAMEAVHAAQAGAADAAETPSVAMTSAAYRDQDWKIKLAIMRDMVALFHQNRCAVALKPEDLMRTVDADLAARWNEEAGTVTMGAWVCGLLKLDHTRCVEGK